MADIFISYAHEDTERVRPLAEALQHQGWSVFWDRRIPAGQTWRSYIGAAVEAARCVIVAWSRHSVASNWVMEEAESGKGRHILVPILLDPVVPPFGFGDIQAANLTEWKGEAAAAEFVTLVGDIRLVLGDGEPATPPPPPAPPESPPAEPPPVGATVSPDLVVSVRPAWWVRLALFFLVIAIAAGGFLLYRATVSDRVEPKNAVSEVRAMIYAHDSGLTRADAEKLKQKLQGIGIPSKVAMHRDPSAPDALFIGALVGAREARLVIQAVPYEIRYLFRPDYPGAEGGDPSGLLIGIGYLSTHYEEGRGATSEPVRVSADDLALLTEPGLSNAEFQRRLRKVTRF